MSTIGPHNDELDRLLAEAMQARRDPELPQNLAARAMARAVARQRSTRVELDRLARQRGRGTLVNFLAGIVLFGLIVAIIPEFMPANSTDVSPDSNSAVTSSVQSLPQVSTTTLIFGASAEELIVLAGTTLFAAVLVFSIERALAAEPTLVFQPPAN